MIGPRVVLLALLPSLLSIGCSTLLLFRPKAKFSRHDVDFREALAFAERADAAYLNRSTIEARYRGRRVVVKDLPRTEVRFFIVFDDRARKQDIAVRGTSNLANIRTDAQINPDPDPKLHVRLHRGFAHAGAELYKYVEPHLRRGYETTITGHSLGGALAAILGMYLKADGVRLTRIITFGQPKVTNVSGARRYAGLPIIRFVNRADPVTDVPPLLSLRDKNWSYTHFGPEVLLWTGNRYIFVEGHQALSVGVLTFWGNLGSHEVQEHKMTAYLSSLRKKVGGAKEIRFEERNRYLN